MSSEINRIRDLYKRGAVRSRRAEYEREEQSLDSFLSYRPSPDEMWQFVSGRIQLNGYDVDELITSSDAETLVCFSAAISEYKGFVWAKGGTAFGKFNGTVDAMLNKILGKLSSMFDGIESGLRFEYLDGDLWVNDINVSTVLSIYKIRPTQKGRAYLAGLKDKLGLILSAQNGSPRYNGNYIRDIFSEISSALDTIPPDDVTRSLPPCGTD